jgi:hypothetical protein
MGGWPGTDTGCPATITAAEAPGDCASHQATGWDHVPRQCPAGGCPSHDFSTSKSIPRLSVRKIQASVAGPRVHPFGIRYAPHPGDLSAGFASLGEQKAPGGGGSWRPYGGFASLGEQKAPGGGGSWRPYGVFASLGEQKAPGGGGNRRPYGVFASLGEQKAPGGGGSWRPYGVFASLGGQKAPGGGGNWRPYGVFASLGERYPVGGGGRRRPSTGFASPALAPEVVTEGIRVAAAGGIHRRRRGEPSPPPGRTIAVAAASPNFPATFGIRGS